MYNLHNQFFICCVCIIIYCFFDLKWFIWIPPPFEYRAAHGYPAAGSWRILWPLHSGCSSTDSAPFDKKFPVSSNASLLCIWISSCFPPIFHQFSSNFPSVFLQFSSSFLPVFLQFSTSFPLVFGFDRSKNLSSSTFCRNKSSMIFLYFRWFSMA